MGSRPISDIPGQLVLQQVPGPLVAQPSAAEEGIAHRTAEPSPAPDTWVLATIQAPGPLALPPTAGPIETLRSEETTIVPEPGPIQKNINTTTALVSAETGLVIARGRRAPRQSTESSSL